MMIHKSKKIIFLCAGICLLVFVIAVCAKTVYAKLNTPHVYYNVTKETYENVIEISGTVQAAEEQTLQALSDGTVVGVYVSEGDHVKKGDIIIQLDDTTQQYDLAKQDYTIASAKITGSVRELELLQAQRLSLVQKVADRKVVATFDGVIAELDVSPGDSLEAKDPVGTLVNVDYLIAEVEIAETDVSKLKKGQKVEFTFSAYKDKTVYGTVVGWPAIGEVTSRGATVVNAKIKIEDYPPEILPNYSFTGKIQISEPEEFFVVSQCAVGYDGKDAYVIKKDSNKKEFVTVIPFGSGTVKISGGTVAEGDVLEELTKPKVSGMSNMNSKNGAGNSRGGFGPPPRR